MGGATVRGRRGPTGSELRLGSESCPTLPTVPDLSDPTGPSSLSWTAPCTSTVAGPPGAAKYEPAAPNMASDGEMKALLVLAIVLLGAATAFAYGRADMADGLSTVVEHTTEVVLTEPVLLLLSGALLLMLGGAVRRFSV